MDKKIAVANQKGGVGKTTTVWGLSTALANMGKKVLMIDLDPHCGLTTCQGIDYKDLKKSSYDVLMEREDINDVIIDLEKYYILPSKDDLSGAEVELINQIGRENRLKEALEKLKIKPDYIFIDCPGNPGLLTVNALCAADRVIIPVEAKFLGYMGIEQIKDLVSRCTKLNKNLYIEGILLTMCDFRTKHTKEIISQVRENEKNVFETYIKSSVKVCRLKPRCRHMEI